MQVAAPMQLGQIDAQPSCAREQEPEFLVEHEQRRTFAALDGGMQVLQEQQRLSRARRPDYQGAGSDGQPAADELIQCGHTAFENLSAEPFALFGGDQTREDFYAAMVDDVVVIAAAE